MSIKLNTCEHFFSNLLCIFHLINLDLMYLLHAINQIINTVFINQSQGQTFVIVPPCSTDSMQINVKIYVVWLVVDFWWAEIDNKTGVSHIDSPSYNIGSQ